MIIGAFAKGRNGPENSQGRVVSRLDSIARALQLAFGRGIAE